MPTRDALELFDMTAPAIARPVDAPTRRPPPPPPPQAPARTTPPPPPPPARTPIAYVGPNYKPGTRPSFADDIDSIVAALVADGLVTLDLDSDTYRTTRRRHWKFEEPRT